MPTIDATNTDWVAVTLTQDEIWMARGGTILVTNEEPVRADQGFELIPGGVRTFRNGMTVRYKPVIPTGVTVAAILVREAL